MKRFKTIINILMTFVLLVVGFFTYSTYQNQQAIQKSLHTPKEITFSLSGFNSVFVPWDEYDSRFSAINHLYHQFSQESEITNFEIFYELPVLFENQSQTLVSATLMHWGEENKLTFGRYFTNEELENGCDKILVNNQMEIDGEKIQVGDKIVLNPLGDSSTQLDSQEFEVIGTYDYHDLTKTQEMVEQHANQIYLPNSTLLELSNYWQNQIDDNKNYKNFIPVSISKVIVQCMSESDFQNLFQRVKIYNDLLEDKIIISRFDGLISNNPIIFQSDIKLMLVILFLIALVWIIAIRFINRYQKHLEESFQKTILKEQEKNIDDIMSINQETHRLKHDLKHFLNHLTMSVETQTKEETLALLKEYVEEIESLDIPSYTKNQAIDYLINQYSIKAKNKKIDFSFSTIILPKINVSERKCYILLSNALDNAFLHGNSQVRFDIDRVEGYCRFIVTNNKSDYVTRYNDSKEHGYGIKSMKQIVHEVNGIFNFSEYDSYYQCIILLPIAEYV